MRLIRPFAPVIVLSLLASTALAGPPTQVRLSLQDTVITAKTSQGQTLWSRALVDCSTTGLMTSTFIPGDGSQKYTYAFSGFAPFSGQVGEFGPLALPLTDPMAQSTITATQAGAMLTFRSAPTFQGGNYLVSAAVISYTSTIGDDLTLAGGLMSLRIPNLFFYHGSDYPGPDRLFIEGTPALKIEVIPAPASSLVLIAPLAARRRRRPIL